MPVCCCRRSVPHLPEGLGELSGVSLSCPRAQLTATEVRCAKGVLKAQSSVLGQQAIQISFHYQFDSGRIDTELLGIRVHDGTLASDGAAVRVTLAD